MSSLQKKCMLHIMLKLLKLCNFYCIIYKKLLHNNFYKTCNLVVYQDMQVKYSTLYNYRYNNSLKINLLHKLYIIYDNYLSVKF